MDFYGRSELSLQSPWCVGFDDDNSSVDSWSAGSKTLEDFDRLKYTWEIKWHGEWLEEGCLRHANIDKGPRLTSQISGISSASSYASSSSTGTKPRRPLWRRLRSLIVRWQDSRRGIQYTKSGPCQMFADWPIPPYPEDYDWDDEL